MTATALSPVLQLAVRLLAEGQTIAAYLCDAVPRDVADIPRCRLGVGFVNGNGGTIAVDSPGIARCIAYDVGGQLVTSQTRAMPMQVQPRDKAKVGPMAFGRAGVPHGH